MYYTDSIEIRRVQALQGERSFTLVLPKEFAVRLGIGKGDFLKCSVDGQRLVVEKVETSRKC
jgi:bifunctional DNA-binding transcriptional regulator/antitoxin component of YhaV-PrlF toxin-antitoxin module